MHRSAESDPYKGGAPLEDWKEWRTEINNCLSNKIMTGRPCGDIVPLDEYLDCCGGGPVHWQHPNKSVHFDTETVDPEVACNNLLMYSNAKDNRTELTQRDFLNYGIPRAAVSAHERHHVDYDDDEAYSSNDERDDSEQAELRGGQYQPAKLLRDVETQTAAKAGRDNKMAARHHGHKKGGGHGDRDRHGGTREGHHQRGAGHHHHNGVYLPRVPSKRSSQSKPVPERTGTHTREHRQSRHTTRPTGHTETERARASSPSKKHGKSTSQTVRHDSSRKHQHHHHADHK